MTRFLGALLAACCVMPTGCMATQPMQPDHFQVKQVVIDDGQGAFGGACGAAPIAPLPYPAWPLGLGCGVDPYFAYPIAGYLRPWFGRPGV